MIDKLRLLTAAKAALVQLQAAHDLRNSIESGMTHEPDGRYTEPVTENTPAHKELERAIAIVEAGTPTAPYTPGPWDADRGFRDAFSHGSGHYTVPDDFMTVFCQDDDGAPPEEQDIIEVHGPNQIANATFISFLPDFYETMKLLAKNFRAHLEQSGNAGMVYADGSGIGEKERMIFLLEGQKDGKQHEKIPGGI